MNRADEAGDRGRVGTVGSVVVKRRNEEAFVPSRRVVRTNHNALENMAPSSSFGLVMTRLGEPDISRRPRPKPLLSECNF